MRKTKRACISPHVGPVRLPPVQTRRLNFHAIAERTNFTSIRPIRRVVVPSTLRSNMMQRARRINQLCDEAQSIMNGIEEMIFRNEAEISEHVFVFYISVGKQVLCLCVVLGWSKFCSAIPSKVAKINHVDGFF